MDIISQIIANKEKKHDHIATDLENMTKELLKYDHLSKVVKFRENVTKYQYLSKIAEPYYSFLLNVNLHFILEFLNRPLYFNKMPDRTLKQNTLISNINKEIVEKEYADTHADYWLINNISDLEKIVISVTVAKDEVIIGRSIISDYQVGERYAPYIKGLTTIYSYSVLGNNDYLFGKYGSFSVKISQDNHNFKLKFLDNEENLVKVFTLSEEDLQSLSSKEIADLAAIINKYGAKI